jgi:hypothetical protein
MLKPPLRRQLGKEQIRTPDAGKLLRCVFPLSLTQPMGHTSEKGKPLSIRPKESLTNTFIVIPAKAGIQENQKAWIPAFAGMTE